MAVNPLLLPVRAEIALRYPDHQMGPSPSSFFPNSIRPPKPVNEVSDNDVIGRPGAPPTLIFSPSPSNVTVSGTGPRPGRRPSYMPTYLLRISAASSTAFFR